MEFDPTAAPYKTSDPASFAYTSAHKRWPVILTGVIDDVHRTTAESTDETTLKEGKKIVEEVAKLKYEMQHGRVMPPLEDDGKPDVKDYNNELEQRGNPNWLDVSWLYSECYLYRRLATIVASTTKWKSYDIFSRQKLETFRSSRTAVIELAIRLQALEPELAAIAESSAADGNDTTATQKASLLFTEFLTISLWGNATDLSLLTNISLADIQALQGARARQAAEANILVNDAQAAFNVLHAAQTSDPNGTRRVDFVLDNAGFELYVDLVFALYLLDAGLATQIVLRPKDIPWFVSDVVPADFAALLNALADPQSFFAEGKSNEHDNPPLAESELAALEHLFQSLASAHAEGKLIVRPHAAWTHAGSFWRLPHTAPALYADLQEAVMVIFKGDLNYRKLTGDVMWDPTTPFATAIGPLSGTRSSSAESKEGVMEGIRTLALRTAKADVIVGLPDGTDERIRRETGGEEAVQEKARRWAWTGKWAVVQFCDGKGE